VLLIRDIVSLEEKRMVPLRQDKGTAQEAKHTLVPPARQQASSSRSNVHQSVSAWFTFSGFLVRVSERAVRKIGCLLATTPRNLDKEGIQHTFQNGQK